MSICSIELCLVCQFTLNDHFSENDWRYVWDFPQVLTPVFLYNKSYHCIEHKLSRSQQDGTLSLSEGMKGSRLSCFMLRFYCCWKWLMSLEVTRKKKCLNLGWIYLNITPWCTNLQSNMKQCKHYFWLPILNLVDKVRHRILLAQPSGSGSASADSVECPNVHTHCSPSLRVLSKGDFLALLITL